MSDITRYTPVTHPADHSQCESTEMQIDDWGNWVTIDDHKLAVEQLQNKIDRLEALLGI